MEGDKFSVFNSTDCVGDTFKLYSLSKQYQLTVSSNVLEVQNVR
jgi:hypothetical protein